MKYCSNCGTQITSESKFCSGCGTQIAETPIQQSKAPTAVPENKVETSTNRILMPDGAVYEGELIDGIANGFGKYFYPKPDGDFTGTDLSEHKMVYEGHFLNGKKHGFGKLLSTFPNYHGVNVFTYEGNWEYNKKCGFGKDIINMTGEITEYVGNFSGGKKHGEGSLKKFNSNGERILCPFNFEGSFHYDKLKEGLFVGSFLGAPPTYSMWYKGEFCFFDDDLIEFYVLDEFPALNGELIFTWLETGESTKHIVTNGKSESYDLMMDEAFDDEDDDDDDEDYVKDSPIKPKDGAGLR